MYMFHCNVLLIVILLTVPGRFRCCAFIYSCVERFIYDVCLSYFFLISPAFGDSDRFHGYRRLFFQLLKEARHYENLPIQIY